MQEAEIILNDGTSYLTPVDNLDNVRRMLAGKYKEINYPGYEALYNEEETEEEEVQEGEVKKRGRKPKATN